MIIECSSCGAKYKYDESKLEGSTGKKIKCPKCKGVIEVKSQSAPAPKAGSAPSAAAMERTFTAVPSAPPVSEPLDDTSAGEQDAPKKTAKVRRETMEGTFSGGKGDDNLLKLPELRKLSLAVIQGVNSGEIFQINKPKMTIGRVGSDIVVKDVESSRQHARIDVMGDRVILRDLNSTNGTYVNEQRIATTNLENHSEFRIGTTVFMLIITDVD